MNLGSKVCLPGKLLAFARVCRAGVSPLFSKETAGRGGLARLLPSRKRLELRGLPIPRGDNQGDYPRERKIELPGCVYSCSFRYYGTVPGHCAAAGER